MDTPSSVEEYMDDRRPPTNALDYHGRDSLFRGTYGQVMVALKAAGLVATPCMEGEFAGGTQSHQIFIFSCLIIISYAFRRAICCASILRGEKRAAKKADTMGLIADQGM